MTTAMIASPPTHMIAPPVWVSASRSTDSPGAATMSIGALAWSSTTPVNVSTAIAIASSSQRAGADSRHRIGSSPMIKVKNWQPTSRYTRCSSWPAQVIRMIWSISPVRCVPTIATA